MRGDGASAGEPARFSDRLSFDTTGMDADAAFAAYCRLYGLGAEILRLGDAVSARVEAWRLDRMLLYDRRLDGLGHRRDPSRTRVDGFDHFTATLLLAGTLEVETAGAPPCRLAPGEVLLADTHVPATNRMHRAHLVTLAIARERMVAMAGAVDGLHALVLTAAEARLFREFVESLLRNLPDMTGNAAMAAGALTTLLMIGIDGRGGAWRSNATAARDVERLAQLRRLVDARIADPGFHAADAVRESGLSRATLYRLAAGGGGLATLIRHRRLDYIRRCLSDAADPRSFADLVDAMGLPSVSHASRAFVERYAIRPSEYRELAQARTGADAFLKMRVWQEEVR